jgi:hypothetical protein
LTGLNLPSEIQQAALADLEHIRANIPADTVDRVLGAIAHAFQKAFNIGIGTAAVAWTFSLFVEWRRVEGKEKIKPESESMSDVPRPTSSG